LILRAAIDLKDLSIGRSGFSRDFYRDKDAFPVVNTSYVKRLS